MNIHEAHELDCPTVLQGFSTLIIFSDEGLERDGHV
jgi:hypothetical protein